MLSLPPVLWEPLWINSAVCSTHLSSRLLMLMAGGRQPIDSMTDILPRSQSYARERGGGL